MTDNEKDLAILEEFYKIITPSKKTMFDSIAAMRTRHLTVVLENVYQEHNASAILRSCDCFGIQELHVIEKNNQYKVQRDIALGAGRWVDLFNFDQGESPTTDCLQKLKRKGYKIIATSPHTKDQTIHSIDLDQPIALVFGTERQGISEEVKSMADGFVQIPMYGFTESFNVSVSVAITLNTLRQRLENSQIDWKLNPEEQIRLKLNWCRKIVREGRLLEDELRKRLFPKE
ncbi:MAG: RNA methyltransferase [Cryomorphaceae bacterium]|nr:RNA methyltransferase [Cryomorphaceae bacterium]